jgi:hypothetical protein
MNLRVERVVAIHYFGMCIPVQRLLEMSWKAKTAKSNTVRTANRIRCDWFAKTYLMIPFQFLKSFRAILEKLV